MENIIKNENLTKITTSLIEIGVDSIMEDGLLKDIPLIGSIVNGIKLTKSISDRILLKKIITFLNRVKDVPNEKRLKMISDIYSNKEFSIKIGEQIIYLLDKADDHNKAQIIGKLFKAFLDGNFSYLEFLKSGESINKIFIQDLSFLQSTSNNTFPGNSENSLKYSHFYSIKFKLSEGRIKTINSIPLKENGISEITYEITDLGLKVRKAIFE